MRAKVYQTIQRYPGLHLRGLARSAREQASLVDYHARKLAEEGFVEAREQGGFVRYFPTPKGPGQLAPADKDVVGVLREPTPLHLVLLLLDEGPQTHGELVARLEVAKSTVSYHLAKLAERGMVVREPGSTRLTLADRERVYALLLAHRPTPDLMERFGDLWGSIYDV